MPHHPRPASRDLLIEILRLHFPWGFDRQPPYVVESMLSVLDPIDHEEAAGGFRLSHVEDELMGAQSGGSDARLALFARVLTLRCRCSLKPSNVIFGLRGSRRARWPGLSPQVCAELASLIEADAAALGGAASHPSAARLLVRVLRREAERAGG